MLSVILRIKAVRIMRENHERDIPKVIKAIKVGDNERQQ